MSDGVEVRQKRLLAGWGVSALLLVVGLLLLLLTAATTVGLVLFVVGVVGSVAVTVGLLRARAAPPR